MFYVFVLVVVHWIRFWKIWISGCRQSVYSSSSSSSSKFHSLALIQGKDFHFHLNLENPGVRKWNLKDREWTCLGEFRVLTGLVWYIKHGGRDQKKDREWTCLGETNPRWNDFTALLEINWLKSTKGVLTHVYKRYTIN